MLRSGQPGHSPRVGALSTPYMGAQREHPRATWQPRAPGHGVFPPVGVPGPGLSGTATTPSALLPVS